MAKALVVVESPAKAKTINKYLGRDFKVIASMGHVRDLPKSKLGVDVDGGFEPEYVVLPDRAKVIKELKEAAKVADEIFVATDPDREGEAIGWHLAEELGGARKKVRRLMFNEITKKAILDAIKHPGTIDMKMVDAQQARRVLDRLVGYQISPILWDKVRRGLSAGRVQSVALKLICDREREIEAFVAEEYWHITARLAADAPPEFDARLMRKGAAAVKIGHADEAAAIVRDLEGASFSVASVTTKERKKHAIPPLITSRLQQASRFPVKKTMMVAQQLYEGIELPGEDAPIGLITYMRTDSVRVSEQALQDVRAHIQSQYGGDYVPEQANRYRIKANAQDAHEAIRSISIASSGTGSSRRRWRPRSSTTPRWTFRLSTTPSARKGRCRSSPAGSRSMARPPRKSRRASGRNVRPPPRLAPAPRRRTRPPRGSCRRSPRGSRSRSARSRPSRSSRSRPRDSARLRLSRRSKRMGSAGRAPTRRSSRCSRRATTSTRSTAGSARRSSAAGWSNGCCTPCSTTSSTSNTRRGWRSSSTRSSRARATTRTRSKTSTRSSRRT
jgi:5S rRNA maturation endonuclease (ribonuclease M5)